MQTIASLKCNAEEIESYCCTLGILFINVTIEFHWNKLVNTDVDQKSYGEFIVLQIKRYPQIGHDSWVRVQNHLPPFNLGKVGPNSVLEDLLDLWFEQSTEAEKNRQCKQMSQGQVP